MLREAKRSLHTFSNTKITKGLTKFINYADTEKRFYVASSR